MSRSQERRSQRDRIKKKAISPKITPCSDRRSYLSRDEAEGDRERINRESATSYQSFFCPSCGFWHVGNPSGGKIAVQHAAKGIRPKSTAGKKGS